MIHAEQRLHNRLVGEPRTLHHCFVCTFNQRALCLTSFYKRDRTQHADVCEADIHPNYRLLVYSIT